MACGYTFVNSDLLDFYIYLPLAIKMERFVLSLDKKSILEINYRCFETNLRKCIDQLIVSNKGQSKSKYDNYRKENKTLLPAVGIALSKQHVKLSLDILKSNRIADINGSHNGWFVNPCKTKVELTSFYNE